MLKIFVSDLSKSIETFSAEKDPKEAKKWLIQQEQKLFYLRKIKVGYRRKLLEEQHKEHVSVYHHEKVALWKKLDLTFIIIIEQGNDWIMAWRI